MRKGDRVKRGAVLGEVGYSGKTQFAHLHLSVRHNGAVIDPFTGEAPGNGCSSTPRTASSLWSDALDLPYEHGQLVQTGFTDVALSTGALEDGSAAARAFTATSPAVIFFARFINLQKGDRIRLQLIGPNGPLADSTSQPLAGAKAQLVRFAGRRRRAAHWTKGLYVGTVWLLRKGKITAQHRASMTLTD